ncbi:MAG: hypothetical protein ABWY29_03550 [Blastococcus sp.]
MRQLSFEVPDGIRQDCQEVALSLAIEVAEGVAVDVDVVRVRLDA